MLRSPILTAAIAETTNKTRRPGGAEALGLLALTPFGGGGAQVPRIRQRLIDRAGESSESDGRFNSKHGEDSHRIADTRTSPVSALSLKKRARKL
ncbi:hypothetical protein [Aureliella helgolandensis]|nr:hypothetical protein [Aureliella helgolandensis]